MINSIIVREKISQEELKRIAEQSYGTMVKVVVDTEREVLSLGCELHVDCSELLLEDGSRQNDLWGANVYPSDQTIDFVSLINIRPADYNRSMEIQKEEIKQRVEVIIRKLIFS